VDNQQEVKPAIEALGRIKAPVRFVSCDPLVTWLQFPTLTCFDWMIIGARPKTKSRPAFVPPTMWIKNLARQAKENGCKIFVKHFNAPNFKEYPGGNESI
jgi:protein gp37